MKQILGRLFSQQYLQRNEAHEILSKISSGEYSPEEICAFLTVFNMRNITVDELMGFRDCMLEKCIRIDLSDFDPIDLCGTGGDGKDSFNISTLSSFIVSGAGYKVAKHGNYGVSSSCGSSNVMQHLGYNFTANPDYLKAQIDKAGICFLHAPLFHPAMKEVAPIRKKLGVRTFFNMLGPMVNPSLPNKQIVGVFSNQLLRYYKYIYEQSNRSYKIIHSLDGYDEISLTDGVRVVSQTKDEIIYPVNLNSERLKPEALSGGKTVADAAKIFLSVLSNKGTKAQKNVVLANSAMAIECYNQNENFDSSYQAAKESLESGSAFNSFKKLIEQ